MSSNTPRLDLVERNLIINGNFDFWQRGTSSSGFGYLADRFKTTGSGSYVTTFAQSTDVPTQAQSGFQSRYSLQVNVTTGASLGSGDYLQVIHILEGQDYQAIHGRKARLQFWCKCSVAGTYAVALRNSGQTRSYVTTFSVSSASTWQKVILDVPFDSSGAWVFDNTAGLQINVGLACGSTYQTSTLNTWQNGNYIGATGQTQLGATTGATFQLAQVMLIPQDFTQAGSTTVDIPFQRAGRSIGHELQMCQRYCYNPYTGTPASNNPYVGTGICFSSTIARVFVPFQTMMRTTPTLNAPTGTTDFVALQSNGGSSPVTSVGLDHVSTSGASVEFDTSSMVAGNAAVVRANVASPTIYFDAEL